MKDKINKLIGTALAAVNPYSAIQNHLWLKDDNLVVGSSIINLTNQDIRCIAVGKAAVPMARSIQALLGDRISQGLVVTKYDHLGDTKFPDTWEVIESAHPVPDDRSLEAGDRIWQFLDNCTDRTLVLACISGGASALAVAPRSWQSLASLLTSPPTAEISQETKALIQTTFTSQSINLNTLNPEENISLSALQSIGTALLGSGLSIEKINAVRSRIDRLKGGGLVDRVGKGKVIGLILSDVIGDSIGSIASGLTNHPAAENILVGNNRQACEAVAKMTIAMGYNSEIITTELDGEAQIRGVEIAREIITKPCDILHTSS